MKQLTAVEKYALAHVSHSERFWKDAQLAAADAEIEAQKQEFDARKLEEMAENLGVSTIEEQSTDVMILMSMIKTPMMILILMTKTMNLPKAELVKQVRMKVMMRKMMKICH